MPLIWKISESKQRRKQNNKGHPSPWSGLNWTMHSTFVFSFHWTTKPWERFQKFASSFLQSQIVLLWMRWLNANKSWNQLLVVTVLCVSVDLPDVKSIVKYTCAWSENSICQIRLLICWRFVICSLYSQSFDSLLVSLTKFFALSECMHQMLLWLYNQRWRKFGEWPAHATDEHRKLSSFHYATCYDFPAFHVPATVKTVACGRSGRIELLIQRTTFLSFLNFHVRCGNANWSQCHSHSINLPHLWLPSPSILGYWIFGDGRVSINLSSTFLPSFNLVHAKERIVHNFFLGFVKNTSMFMTLGSDQLAFPPLIFWIDFEVD